MQLICSDNRGLEDRLTIGKVYEGYYFNISDNGDYSKIRFTFRGKILFGMI